MIREKDEISKLYLTIVSGRLREELHLQDKMIKDKEQNKIVVLSQTEQGKSMETVVRPLRCSQRYTLV